MTDFIDKGDSFIIESLSQSEREGEEGSGEKEEKKKSSAAGEGGEGGGAYTARSARTGPVVVLVIGMAGSGKTTLMHRINHYTKEQGKRGYYINLDPGECCVSVSVRPRPS